MYSNLLLQGGGEDVGVKGAQGVQGVAGEEGRESRGIISCYSKPLPSMYLSDRITL